MNELERKKYLEYIKNNLTIDQIYEFLAEMGGEPQIRDEVIVSRTICHNPPGHGSFKLYYYNNTKLFRCFTECSEQGAFDIFQLTLKIKTLAGEQIKYWSKEAIEKTRPWDLPDAIHFVAIFFGLEEENENFSIERTELQDWQILNKLEAKKHHKLNKQIISLNHFKDSFLNNYPQPIIVPWIKEGISQEIMIQHNIRYNPKSQGIIIPHYDIDNTLIGVRERTLLQENEIYGKYKPAILNGIMYNHPLSFNLYNLNRSKENIRVIKKVIIFEGEKSTLLYGSYFGTENDISVATCGSSLINYQVELLLTLGVQEIIIAFDRQYKTLQDKEWEKWTTKLYKIHEKYGNIVQISFLFDLDNKLNYKDSPIDEGKDTFLYLFKKRIIL